MATPIRMPDFGTNVEEVKLLAWLKQVGQTVARGEALCEVETDKATVELESIADGVLLAQVVPAGSDLQEGTIIAYVGQPGEQAPTPCTTGVSPVFCANESRTGGTPVPQERHIKAAPMIRNLAQREGVDLSTVRGTGPGGQITRDNVLRAKAPHVSAGSSPAAPSVSTGSSLSRTQNAIAGAGQDPALTRGASANQRAVARRVAQSHREIVPINLVGKINMSAAIALRQKSPDRKVSFDAIFVYALSRILKQFPQFALQMTGEEIRAAQGIHIGLAISVGTDLYTPTIFNADKKSLAEIDANVRELSDKARAGKLKLEEMSGAIFTLSNLGMLPVTSFNAVIPPGQAAALAVGAIEQVLRVAPLRRGGLGGGSPAPQDTPKSAAAEGCHPEAPAQDQIVSEPIATVTLSVDHRLINGRQGAEFFAALKEFVEKL